MLLLDNIVYINKNGCSLYFPKHTKCMLFDYIVIRKFQSLNNINNYDDIKL